VRGAPRRRLACEPLQGWIEALVLWSYVCPVFRSFPSGLAWLAGEGSLALRSQLGPSACGRASLRAGRARGRQALAEEDTSELRSLADLSVEPQERSWDGTSPRGFREEQTPESVETLRGERTGRWEARVSGLPVPHALKGKKP
jgi:hypothetical protein